MSPAAARSPLAPDGFPDIGTVPGVRLATVEAGLRYELRHDLMLLELASGTHVAGVFTRSRTAGHPVTWCRRILAKDRARALIVNAGNANVFRAGEGDRAVELEAEAVARALHCPTEEVFVASTGVIGERLPVEKIVEHVPGLVERLGGASFEQAAAAIMTTDTFAKGSVRRTAIDGVEVTVAGIAKGSGMIAPDMATMLAFIVTDADLPSPLLQSLLERACEPTFNAITVDGDTSTSDTLLLFATAQAKHHPVADADDTRLTGFFEALLEVCRDLALQIVRDGEGAQKLIAVTVEGAVSDASAKRIGLSIANSPLVKTALGAADANWGRIIMAVGKADEPIEADKLDILIGGHAVALGGAGLEHLDEGPVANHLAGREVDLNLRVGAGRGAATVWTCDLTHGYVDINASYRS